ncbi:MAG: cyclic nucleotide-binding domain-containing protein [Myxococcota bacterium]|jgi:CRP-like cAMP-binding protein|nr:cyclic nucleotide-binding domain-containing protein [Myxococcota bacterium]
MSVEQTRTSLRAFQQAVAADPTNVDLRESLANDLSRLGHLRQAAEELVLCTKLAAARGDLPRALSCCKRLLELDPDRREVLRFLSRFYARQMSESDLLRAIEHDEPAQRPVLPQPREPRYPEPPLNLPEVNRSPFTILDTEQTRLARFEELGLEASQEQAAENRASALDPSHSNQHEVESIELTVVTLDVELSGDELLSSRLSSDALALEEWEQADPHRVPSTHAPLPIRRSELPRIPLFSSLGAQDFEDLLDELELIHLSHGQEVVPLDPALPDTPTPALWILARGRMNASCRADDGLSIELGEVPLGSFIGELEMLTAKPSRVSYQTLSSCDFLCLSAARFHALRQAHQSVARSLDELFEKRLLRERLAVLPTLRRLPVGERELLGRFARRLELSPGEPLLAVGQQHDSFFLLVFGCLELLSQSGEALGRLELGDAFGLKGFYGRQAALCGVRAKTRSRVFRLGRASVQELLAAHELSLDAEPAPLDDPLDLGLLDDPN